MRSYAFLVVVVVGCSREAPSGPPDPPLPVQAPPPAVPPLGPHTQMPASDIVRSDLLRRTFYVNVKGTPDYG
jgi:hypothetical protein